MSTSEIEPLLREGDSGSPFQFTKEELASLVDPKDPDGLRKYGGTDQILKGLRVNSTDGLSSDEGLGENNKKGVPFRERRKYFGKNATSIRYFLTWERERVEKSHDVVLPDVASKSLFSLIWEAYQDKTLIMLSIAALFSLGVGISEDYSLRHPEDEPRVGWIEGTAILVAVAAVVLTNAINDYQKEKQFKKLNAKKEDRSVKLVRDGREQQISVHEINVGDILLLEPGDIVPVDGIYLSGHNLTCDESSATGESDALKKNDLESDGDPFILSGSKVLEGVGRVVVIAVGPYSYFGKTMMALRGDENTETPLQMKLDILAEHIAKLGMSAALLMLITLGLKYFITAAISHDDFPDAEEIAAALIQIIIQAITIVVVAVPEGLPMAVTLALAYATTQMLKDNNLVRVLSACETMGNATAVCSDKTGTLTQNKMTIVRGFLTGHEFNSVSEIEDWRKDVNQQTFDTIVEAIVTNSTAFEGKDENNKIDFIGSKTECALLGFCKALGIEYREIRNSYQFAKIYPFASKKKTMTTVIKLATPSKDGEYRVHVKGASEIVLGSCTRYIDGDGNVKELDSKTKGKFEKTIQNFAEGALRTICLGYRDVSSAECSKFDDDNPPNDNLICLGIVGIQDPLRPGVTESVKAFRKAGVYVRMITGDNLVTAKAIAKEAGILTKGVAITGPEFRKLSNDEQRKMVPRLQVLARSSPTDKTIVVKRLRELDEIVAVTGDGTNDGPALKLADVGFSMGITGTEVAKEASSIILMDDNFNSIINALKWGRAVNDSVRKFLQFQLTVNITAVVISFTSALLSDDNESVLTAVQLLWVNLIMDTLAALALATEPPTDDLLNRYPTLKTASLISYRMWKMIICEAIFQIIINLTLLHLGPAIFHLGDSKQDKILLGTIIFNTFVFLQVFNEINCRIIDDHLNVFKNIFNNHVFLIVQFVVITGQFLIVEFGGVAFGTTPLTWYQWLATVMIGSLSLPVGVIIRLFPNTCVPDRILNEERKPLVTHSEMRWDAAIHDVRNQLKVFGALRKVRRNSKHSEHPENIEESPESSESIESSDSEPVAVAPKKLNFADAVHALRPQNQ
ncbi:12139_t:CDS:10 [Ambispora leptoticha]|uniref:Calcium-transporting ATPase n=1 Tax=Ambispora leptoticha TaxID=144679 RepID=A0A9N9F5F5_9GLOM|nr:12139_t:CDS:10 [Ambispora leptoticha]